MDDSLAMRGVESTGNLDGDAEGFFDGQRPFAEACFEGFPFEVFHDEEVGGVFAPDVVEGADMGVIETGDGAGFALEALGEADAANFDGDGSFEAGVAGFVDFAHASCAEHGDDFVRP